MSDWTIKELYIACKNKVGFHRSDRFKEWFHLKYPKKIMHHAYGSYSQSLKTSDYCSIPVTHKQHEEAERDKSEFAIEHQPLMLQVMIEYIIYLEGLVGLAEDGQDLAIEVRISPETKWTAIMVAKCSFCEEDFVIQNKRQLNPCPNCHKPLKLIKMK